MAALTAASVASPRPSRSRSRVGRYRSPMRTANSMAPLRTNRSRCFDCDVDADRVTELETVNDGPRRTRHADFDALDVVHVDAGREGGAREPDRPNRREVHSRYPGATIHREPDLAGILGSQAVKPK